MPDPVAPPSPDTITAEIVAVRWRADDGDFAVVVGRTPDGEQATITGPLGHVHEGEAVELGGDWREHPKHGRQFHARRVVVQEPVSGQAIRAYLGAIKHVGPKGALWLHERHGDDVLTVVDADPRARLLEVPGIGRAKVREAVASWEDQGALRAVRLFLETHGVPASVAARIYRVFGAGAIEQLRADPYALTQMDGIGFRTADALARALGTPADSEGRLDAGLLHALDLAELDGHCYLPRAALLARAAELLDVDAAARVDVLAAQGLIEIDEDDRVAEARLAAIERRLARHAHELATAEPVLELREEPARPTGGPFTPTDEQWGAVELALAHRLSILTGGPGTGKSSAMRALVDVLREGAAKVRLCAPTGKAARRLAEVAGVDATTIHRLLEYVPGEGFTRDHEDPIPGADVLIVDEASMLDVRLAGALFDAVGPATHVLLVGDVDQLAPVGPGRVLEDLIDSGVVPTTRLTAIFRQAARSLIVRAAHAMNHGEPLPTVPGEGDLRDFFLIQRPQAAAAFAEICDLAATRLPSHYELHPVGDVQILAPMHKGPLGIDAFNEELRRRLNPHGKAIPGTALRIGDRVLQTKNDHEHELMNGELGVLVDNDTERSLVIMRGDDGRTLSLPVASVGTLKLAYATSVHKAQGSQAKAVVVPLFRGHAIMLTRNLLYTAITRAERVCVLVGDPSALQIAAGRRDATTRHTRLAGLVAA
ncbi:SF1B family DNA helicase RecD2 [Paraconexibacter algicola]|uniref:ATP-dependent RecD2 DNA helicase n=1 Tax=Paraconexibacter algicola TaxID=2133960 RepID=A0A2T4UCG7_9ACTN|nr:ATP-dependent RecD-like DNA helicase [Paraconexibacter algicola]PTL54925.1 ATP-dependent RecD-like DNA helicase [Paraconexibacter algicola]